MAEHLNRLAPSWLGMLLRAVALKANGTEQIRASDIHGVLNDPLAREVCERFGWVPKKIMKSVRNQAKESEKKMKGLGKPVTAFEFADYLVAHMPFIVSWAFRQAVEIIKKRD
jgi:hypothetical protein